MVMAAARQQLAEQHEFAPDGIEDSFEDVFHRLAPRFGRPEVRRHAETYLRGLLGDLPRKTGRQLARHAGRSNPDGLQRLLTTAVWDAEDVQADLRDYVVGHLGVPDGVLVIGEAGFAKKGDKSAGVAEQLNRMSGRVENCQIGLFMSYTSERGSALIDRVLYLPQPWVKDPLRRRMAGIPADVGYASNDVLARMMLDRFSRSGAPFRWVVARKSGDGTEVEQYCEQRRIGHILQVDGNERIVCGAWAGSARELARHVPQRAFERRLYGDIGGSRQYDWAVVKVGVGAPGFSRTLLVCRNVDDSPDLLFDCHAPAAATLAELIRVAERRFATYECVLESRRKSGLDDYEVRKYTAWHRHMTLSPVVAALLRTTRSIPALTPMPLGSPPASGEDAVVDGVVPSMWTACAERPDEGHRTLRPTGADTVDRRASATTALLQPAATRTPAKSRRSPEPARTEMRLSDPGRPSDDVRNSVKLRLYRTAGSHSASAVPL